ncbi:MAG TPA: hypothetical protein VFH43_00775 [Candidatus Kapabacteria bacterium]|nr:hypothetical protein [Candidatus Kapabacteria bacterium]
MKYLHLLVSLCCVYGIAINDAQPQGLRDHVGREFIVVFGPNTGGEPDVETNNEMSIVLTTTTPANVTIEAAGVNLSRQRSLGAGVSEAVVLPSGNDGGPTVMVQRTDNEKVLPRSAVHVISDADISVFGRNHKRYSTDAFLVLPVDALGRSYRVMSYPVSMGQGAPMPSQFMIAAIEHNTEVQITLAANSASGRKKGERFTVTLGKLDVYLVQSSLFGGEDLTGTIIEANKPIAVFSGHERAAVPEGAVLYDGSPASRDHLVEQLPPVEALGDTFLLAPLPGTQRPSVLRLLAVAPNTRVSIDGVQFAVLQEGEIFTIGEFHMPRLLVSSKPALVAHFLPTAMGRLGDTQIPAWGDPAMTIVPPVEQYLKDYAFHVYEPPTTEGVGRKFITLVLPAQAYSTTFIDDAGLGTVNSIEGTDWVTTTLELQAGFHRIRSSHAIGVTIFGMTAIGSIALPAGMGVEPGGLTKSDVGPEATIVAEEKTIIIGPDRQLRLPLQDVSSALEIYDRAGRLIERSEARPGSLDLSNYAAGIYFYRTSEAKGSFLIP